MIAPHSLARSVVTLTSMEVKQFILQEFVQNRTVEQIVVTVCHGFEVYLLPKEFVDKVENACRRQWR